MNLSIEDLRRLIFYEKKTYEEIAKIYGVSPNKIKNIVKTSSLPVDRVKKCGTCNSGPKTPPLEGSGGMVFDLTKD
jgi:hypothetical protein